MTWEGYAEEFADEQCALLRRKGTPFTVWGSKLTIEAFLAASPNELFLQLRYGSFVIFDTGDLKRLAEELTTKLSSSPVGA